MPRRPDQRRDHEKNRQRVGVGIIERLGIRMNKKLYGLLLSALAPVAFTLLTLWDVGKPIKPSVTPNYTCDLPVAMLLLTVAITIPAFLGGRIFEDGITRMPNVQDQPHRKSTNQGES